MKRQTRNAVLMAAAAGGLLADGVKGAPLVDISILACPTQNGVYSSTLQVTAGQTYYYEIIGQLAPVGTDNSHADITSITPGTDGISSLYMNFYDSASAANGISFSTISNALATPSTTPAAAQNWAGGTGAMTATVQNYSGGTDNELLGVRPVGGNATLTAAAAPDVLYIGTFTIGSAPASSSQVVGQWDGSNFGGFKINGGSAAVISGTTEASADPYVTYAPLTLSTGTAASLVWSGTNSSNWDLNTTANFTGQKFTEGSPVTFGDTDGNANAVATSTVNIAANGVYPSFVTFDNKTTTYTLAGADSDGICGNGNVTINGGGKVIFSTANTYTGGTNIANGTLQAISGSLPGQVTIGALGKLALGASGATPGALTTGNQTWVGGGSYAPRVNGGASGAADLLNIGSGGTGTLTLSGSGAFTIAPQSGNTTLGSTSENWEIAAFNSTISGYSGTLPSGTGVSSGVAVDSQFALDTSAFSAPSSDFSLSLVSLGGGDDALYLNYTPTPEPATIILSLGAAAPILLGRRRRIGANRM